jgi:hypothetical protein
VRKDAKKISDNRQSLSWGFLSHRIPQKCVWTDRSTCLEILERQQRSHARPRSNLMIHSANVPCVGIMFCTSVLEVVFPLKQWSYRTQQDIDVDGQNRTEPGRSNDDKIFFMKYPLPFL